MMPTVWEHALHGCLKRLTTQAMAMLYSVTALGDVLQPLTGSNRAGPSPAVRRRPGFASRITGKRLGKEARGTMKRRGLELG